MRGRATGLLFGVALLAALGCASTPKPKEIVALEDLRANPTLSDPDRRAFDLLAAADGMLVQASRAWERRDPIAARRDALMGQIKMKTALALLQAERTRARIAELDEELAISRDEQERLDAELATAQEETDLLERLRAMKLASAMQKKALSEAVDSAKKQAATERQRLTEQLSSEKRRAEALDGIRVVELTLKIAETVEAPRYAKAKYTAATAMLQDAHKEFDAGHWDESATRSTLAKAEAETGSRSHGRNTRRPRRHSATTHAIASSRPTQPGSRVCRPGWSAKAISSGSFWSFTASSPTSARRCVPKGRRSWARSRTS